MLWHLHQLDMHLPIYVLFLCLAHLEWHKAGRQGGEMKYKELHVNEALRGKVLVFICELSRSNKSPPKTTSILTALLDNLVLPQACRNTNQVPIETHFTHDCPKSNNKTSKTSLYLDNSETGSSMRWHC